MTIRLFSRPALLFALCALAGAASAQVTPVAEPAEPRPYCPTPEEFEGRDPAGLPLDAALDALLAYELDVNGNEDVMGRAKLGAHPDRARPEIVARLKAVVDAYVCDVPTIADAFDALRLYGEPDDYFIDYVRDAAPGQRISIAQAALHTLVIRITPELYRQLGPIVAAVEPWGAIYLDREAHAYRLVERGLGPDIGLHDEFSAFLPRSQRVAARAEETLSDIASSFLTMSVYDAAADTMLYTESYMGSSQAWDHVVMLRGMARAYPAEVAAAWEHVRGHLTSGREFIHALIYGDPARTGTHDLTAAEVRGVLPSLERMIERAVPEMTEELPAVGDAAIRPLAPCVREETGGLTAWFAYEYDGPAVRVLRGPQNGLRVGDRPINGEQPEGFARPGLDFEQRWRVRLDNGDPLTWALMGQTVTASRWSPRCDAPPPPAQPTCDGRPATVYVGADGRIVGGPDSGELYAGTLRGTNGRDVLVGTPGPDRIEGGNGPDTLCGLDGDDALSGGNGPDVLLGGPGADAADGGRGPDACAAESETACERQPPGATDAG